MKKIFAVITLLISLASAAEAQYYRRGGQQFLLGANAAYSVTTRDFGKIAKNGTGANLSARYLINEVIGLGFETGYHNFKSKIGSNTQIAQETKYRLIPLLLEATFYIPTWDRSLLPYLGVHFGGYMALISVSKQDSGYEGESVKKKLNSFSPGGGPHAGLLIELNEFVKLDLRLRGDYVATIEADYSDEYQTYNTGFDKILNFGGSVGLLYTF
ncbi:MAG: porin family protein [Culturomica sp.]|jgi:opacity protein-like surface antigen|nr:porin family protein [Culturomica sp.]